ncbi:hypothetical protein CF386_10095 [Paraphotobacterium marinum]|uniref:Uncharacterized protein n=1 Tax=Paraphotobacterium marinum TaxID=1755811 RepID=A0A220VGH0_9GAMM|nr:hypothetical protein [Paraphotobacterium marinum]ASK79401.1 hypothetical protein CF386_10095 [Paraphotobacterium marinum]
MKNFKTFSALVIGSVILTCSLASNAFELTNQIDEAQTVNCSVGQNQQDAISTCNNFNPLLEGRHHEDR